MARIHFEKRASPAGKIAITATVSCPRPWESGRRATADSYASWKAQDKFYTEDVRAIQERDGWRIDLFPPLGSVWEAINDTRYPNARAALKELRSYLVIRGCRAKEKR